MSYTAKCRARVAKRAEARRKARGEPEAPREILKTSIVSRAGNAPNRAALQAASRNPKRRELLEYVGAISRSARQRRALLEALRATPAAP